jgi:two-component system sensor kinase FixL
VLRKQAEKRLRESGPAGKPIPKRDVLELIHELEVHQVELEMQNDELRRAHSELEGERKKYFDLYDLSPVGYMTLDRGGCIREINLSAAQMLGRPRRYLKGSRFARFVDAAQRDDFNRFYKKLFQSGGRDELELRLWSKDNAAVTAVISGVAIIGGVGDVDVCQMAITDITVRVAAEHWRQKLIETTQDAVIAIDADAQIVLFNSAAESIFGYTSAEVVGKKVNMLMAEPYQREHDRYIAHYERTGERRAIGRIREVTARRKNGEVFPIELSVTELGESDEPRYAAFIRDVSEKTNLQADLLERTRLATVGETATQMAHEIANPLNGIAMSIEVLERRMLANHDTSAQTTLKRIANELSRLKSLLFDVRDLSREPKYTRRPLALNAIVEEICVEQRPICKSEGILVKAEMESGLPLVFADGDRIKQVLLNLWKNAEEAMPDGGTLTLYGYPSKDRVILEVRDTGSGIAADQDVFRPFKSTKAGGSGLGLVISRQIVMAHGGTLTYTSSVGKGTSFFLSLPAMPPTPAGEASG